MVVTADGALDAAPADVSAAVTEVEEVDEDDVMVYVIGGGGVITATVAAVEVSIPVKAEVSSHHAVQKLIDSVDKMSLR